MKLAPMTSILAALPPIRCVVCDKLVDGVTTEHFEHSMRTLVTVTCHGETDQMELDRKFLVEMGGADGPEGRAFVRLKLAETKLIEEAQHGL